RWRLLRDRPGPHRRTGAPVARRRAPDRLTSAQATPSHPVPGHRPSCFDARPSPLPLQISPPEAPALPGRTIRPTCTPQPPHLPRSGQTAYPGPTTHPPEPYTPPDSPLVVLHQDAQLLLVNKPAGL